MNKVHYVFYIPGLNDQRKSYELIINRWKMYGINPLVYRVDWHNNESFQPKLIKLVSEIDKYLDKGGTVSLVGASAGGSAVLNALIEQPRINAVVNLCGRLRSGENARPSLEWAARNSKSFKESVLLFESREPKMSEVLKEKVLNLIPIWDEVVPKSTVSLIGSNNKTLYSAEHMLSGLLGMTIYSPILINFLKNKANDLKS